MTQVLDTHIPAPLEFLTKDTTHPDNQQALERQQNRWRLLKWYERIKLNWYVNSLARELHKRKYNPYAKRLQALREAVRAEKEAYALARQNGDKEAGRKHRARILALIDQARPVAQHLYSLSEVKARFDHYSGWLDYEAKHRRELAEDKKLDERERKQMTKESKHLEDIMIRTFKNTAGCHYMRTDKETGKQKAIAPKFDRDMIRPDAHYFLLAVRRRVLFGYRVRLPYTVSVDRLMSEEVLNNLRAATGRQVDVTWSETGQVMFRVSRLDSPDALPKFVRWSQLQPHYPVEKRDKFPFAIGVGEARKPIWMDFESEHHLLIAGQSGSGKSNVVNGIVASLASTHSPAEMRMVLIDMKGGVEFQMWHELPHVLGDVISTVDAVKPRLTQLVDIMNHRLELFVKMNVKKLSTYNRRVPQNARMPRILILVDEMNTFVGLKGGLTDDIQNLFMMLASQGRAVGMNLIMATQYPEVLVVPNRIKGNMGVRMSGRMPTRTTSEVIVDTGAAADLPAIAGRFVAVRGMDEYIVQTPYISDEDIQGVVSSCQMLYTEVSETLPEADNVPNVIVWDEQRFIEAALDWNSGKLSAQTIHKMLADESPGERHFKRLVQRVVDGAQARGYVERKSDGSKWTIKPGNGGTKVLVPLAATPDTSDVPDAKTPPRQKRARSEKASEPIPAMTESAAD